MYAYMVFRLNEKRKLFRDILGYRPMPGYGNELYEVFLHNPATTPYLVQFYERRLN